MCSATLLTSRDAFFNKGEYMQLVYVACTPWLANKGPGAHPMTEPIELEPPTMLKPRVMWTGKQVGGGARGPGSCLAHEQQGGVSFKRLDGKGLRRRACACSSVGQAGQGRARR